MSEIGEPLAFTDREIEVCTLVAQLKSQGAIARELGISVRTVETHIHSAARRIPGKGQPMKRIIRHFSSIREIT
jgi:DNA-binding CsgD family transcriptional regulator